MEGQRVEGQRKFNDLMKDSEFAMSYRHATLVTDSLEDLAKVMEQRGLTMTDLSKLLGVSLREVRGFFGGQEYSTRTLVRYADALGLTVAVTFSLNPEDQK